VADNPILHKAFSIGIDTAIDQGVPKFKVSPRKVVMKIPTGENLTILLLNESCCPK